MSGESSKLREHSLLALGNPLLDIIAVTDKTILEKYNLEANGAILGDERHATLYDELASLPNVEFVAGGSAENTVRALQWILGKPHVSTFIGCIGRDKYGQLLEEKAHKDGVFTCNQVHDTLATGTCAVIITGHNRSLVANLSAAKEFNFDHVKKPENWVYVDKASFIYATSYVLNVTPLGTQLLGEHATNNNKTFALNLSAPYLCSMHKTEMEKLMPYVDILFGNETEAVTFAQEQKLGSTNIEEIALLIAKLPKVSGKPRLVIITQGTDPVLVVKDGQLSRFPVERIPDDQIVDTNAAGDCFTGGFLAQYIQDKSIETCVRCGVYAAQEVIRHSGCTFPEKPNFSE